MYPFTTTPGIPTTTFGTYGQPYGATGCTTGAIPGAIPGGITGQFGTPSPFGWQTAPGFGGTGFGGTGFAGCSIPSLWSQIQSLWSQIQCLSTPYGITPTTSSIFGGTTPSQFSTPFSSSIWPQTITGSPFAFGGWTPGFPGGVPGFAPTAFQGTPWSQPFGWTGAQTPWTGGVPTGYGCSPIHSTPWTSPFGWTTPSVSPAFGGSPTFGTVPFTGGIPFAGTTPFVGTTPFTGTTIGSTGLPYATSPYATAPYGYPTQATYPGQSVGYAGCGPTNGQVYGSTVAPSHGSPIFQNAWTPSVSPVGFTPSYYGQQVPFVHAGHVGFVSPIGQGSIGATSTPTMGLHREAA